MRVVRQDLLIWGASSGGQGLSLRDKPEVRYQPGEGMLLVLVFLTSSAGKISLKVLLTIPHPPSSLPMLEI